MIQLGARSALEAQLLWDRLFDALSVTEDDDIWARWLQEEFGRHKKVAAEWTEVLLEGTDDIPYAENARVRFPAQQFVCDLDAIIAAKQSMTRRQWISLLEAVIRLGAVSHVLWLCRVNEKMWRAVSSILGHGDARTIGSEEDLREQIVMGERRYLSYGNPAVPIIKNYASGYLVARAGLNLVLWALKEQDVQVGSLQTATDLWGLLKDVERSKAKLNERDVLGELFRIQDDEARTIACKKGIGSNLIEFSRHTLGQRQTTNDSLRGYDQSYFLSKRNNSRNAPWRLSLGPVAVLAIAHCCLREVRGPRSIQRLSDHLANYGIDVDTDDISSGELGAKLRTLGLVLDSPDAETGMLLIPPFKEAAP